MQYPGPSGEDTALQGRMCVTLRKQQIQPGSAAVQQEPNPTWNATSEKCESAVFTFWYKTKLSNNVSIDRGEEDKATEAYLRFFEKYSSAENFPSDFVQVTSLPQTVPPC